MENPTLTTPQSVDEGLVERIKTQDPYLIDYLLGWAGLGPQQPWGAATSFALEMAVGYRLIRGESDATLTDLGKQVAAALSQPSDVGEIVERRVLMDDGTWSEADPEYHPVRKLVDEARRLSNDVLGTFQACEDAIREAMGNTNFTVIKDNAERVEQALSAWEKR